MKLHILVSLLLFTSVLSLPLNFPNNDDEQFDDDDYSWDENDDIILSPSPPPIPKSTKPSPTPYFKQKPPPKIYISWIAMNTGICANPKGCPSYRVPQKCTELCKYQVIPDMTKPRYYNVEKPCSDCMVNERCKSQCNPTPTTSCNGCLRTYQF